MFAALTATALLAVAPVGPPTLCHSFQIGEARSLPWGEGAYQRSAGYELEHLPRDTYDILLRSDDPLVHAETLRRAVLYLSGSFDTQAAPPKEQRDRLATALLAELQFDADVHAPEAKAARESATAAAPASGPRHRQPPLEPAWGGRVCQASSRDAALCFLDLGYLRAALRAAGASQSDDGTAALRDALLLRPKDGSLELAAALGLVDQPDAATRAEGWRHLDSVARRIEDAPADDRLARNLLSTVGPLLNAKDHDDLAQRLHERAAQG